STISIYLNDLVNQTETLSTTKCGHIFHYQCLIQWIARSKSCPQCRNKVTESSLLRIYPTISNENQNYDAATLQSRLDDALLQLRQEKIVCKEKEDKITSIMAALKRNEEILKEFERKYVSAEAAVQALQMQMKYLKQKNNEAEKLKEENEVLNKNLQTLNGLQRVLNATSEEVERMLEGYTDVRTIATFATALKRALCESEDKKNKTRDQLEMTKQELAAEKNYVKELQTKIGLLEEKISMFRQKLKEIKEKKIRMFASEGCGDAVGNIENAKDRDESQCEVDAGDTVRGYEHKSVLNTTVYDLSEHDTSIKSLVNKIESAASPYLNLQQCSLALSVLQRHPTLLQPDKRQKLCSAQNRIEQPACQSIFSVRERADAFSFVDDDQLSKVNATHDGLGGRARADHVPLRNPLPRLTLRH
ncbi:unnamed protein product, partial [Leptidea sinapis]